MEQYWFEQVIHATSSEECISIRQEVLPGSGKVVVLAPHPDDPDTCAIFQRMLFLGGWSIQWLILTSAWSGVRDEYAGPSKEAKGLIRRQEQLDSACLFGLDEYSIRFLNLPETEDGELADDSKSYARIIGILETESPRIVILPWGQDTNPTHRLVYEWFERWRKESLQPVTAFYSEDPKSQDFKPHLRILFDGESARWKASLLECHRSQTERNLATRGCTFFERILAMNQIEDGLYAEKYRVSSD